MVESTPIAAAILVAVVGSLFWYGRTLMRKLWEVPKIITYWIMSVISVIVPDGHAIVVERFGKYSRTCGPGWHWLVPLVERCAEIQWSLPRSSGKESDDTAKTSHGIRSIQGKLIPLKILNMGSHAIHHQEVTDGYLEVSFNVRVVSTEKSVLSFANPLLQVLKVVEETVGLMQWDPKRIQSGPTGLSINRRLDLESVGMEVSSLCIKHRSQSVVVAAARCEKTAAEIRKETARIIADTEVETIRALDSAALQSFNSIRKSLQDKNELELFCNFRNACGKKSRPPTILMSQKKDTEF
jgi:hypothetical protein